MSGRGPPPRESLAPQLIIPRKKTLIRRGVRLLTRHPREPLHFSLPSVSYANTPAIIQIPSFHPLERYALQNLLWREGPLLEKKRNNGTRVLELIKIPYRVEGRSHLSNSFEPGWMEIVFSSLIDFETMDGSGLRGSLPVMKSSRGDAMPAMLLGSCWRDSGKRRCCLVRFNFFFSAVLLVSRDPRSIYIGDSWILLCAFRNAEECSRLRYWRAGVIRFPFSLARV